MKYEVLPDRWELGVWRVEAIDPTTGECFVAQFSCTGAEERAKEYADFKNGLYIKFEPILLPRLDIGPKILKEIKFECRIPWKRT